MKDKETEHFVRMNKIAGAIFLCALGVMSVCYFMWRLTLSLH